ncbi:MAG: hypothetical protein EBY21_12445, partial [Alphaproteobacteria bacterium]|nr:hypothetical protein [Alphaproteobacteria bacterium]
MGDMVDYAQRLLSQMSSLGSARTGLVNRVQQKLDSNQDGQLSGAEFQTFFAKLQLDPSRASDLSSNSSGSGLHKTLFQCMLYPSFSHNYALAAYQAQEMIKGLDSSKDGQISTAELMTYGQAPSDPTSNPLDPKPQDPPPSDPNNSSTDTPSL